MSAEELGELYDEKRRQWEEAKAIPGSDEYPEDYVIEVARRLGLVFDPPDYSPLPSCRRCGARVESRDGHTRWHELVAAGIKVAQFEANLGHLGAAFLGIALRELFGEEILTSPPAKPDGSVHWTPSGHGHLYPLPNGSKARCGGPLMCAKCAADLEHSRRVGDGAAERWERTSSDTGAGEQARPSDAGELRPVVNTILDLLEPLDQEARGRVLAAVVLRLGLPLRLA